MKTKTLTVIYRQGRRLAAALSLVLAATPWAAAMEDATPPPRPSVPIVQASYGKLPLSFEANQGQWDASVQFVTRGRGHQLFLTPNEAVLTVRTGRAQSDGRPDPATQPKQFSSSSPDSHSVVRMQFAGADPQAEVVGLEPLPGIVNYFIGDDPSKWRTNIPTYQKVGYKDLYPASIWSTTAIRASSNMTASNSQDLCVTEGAEPTDAGRRAPQYWAVSIYV